MKIASLFLVMMVFCVQSRAMDDDAGDWEKCQNETSLRFVFLGKTGAGKSTAINACYNFVKKTRWNDYPKHFPIPTEFQECNVESYQNRNVEDHQQGQLNAVTQKPSEYVAVGDGYSVSFIDCPGTADPRGVHQDNQNIAAAAEALKRTYCHAFCIVLKSSTNRETIEELYSIEQIKSMLPRAVFDRIFIVVTHDTGGRANVVSFVHSMGLPVDNVFFLENFALTKDGYVDLRTIDTTFVEDEDIGDPFTDEPIKSVDNRLAIAKMTRTTWTNSNREFNRMLKRAKRLGAFWEMYSFCSIAYVKTSFTELIESAVAIKKSLQESEGKLATAKKELASAVAASERAQEALLAFSREYLKAATDADICERQWEWASAEKFRAEASRLEGLKDLKLLEHLQAWAMKDAKNMDVDYCNEELHELGRNLESLIKYLHVDLAALRRETMCPPESKVCDYYEVCIRREQDPEKRARLNLEMKVYEKLFAY